MVNGIRISAVDVKHRRRIGFSETYSIVTVIEDGIEMTYEGCTKDPSRISLPILEISWRKWSNTKRVTSIKILLHKIVINIVLVIRKKIYFIEFIIIVLTLVTY